MSAANVWRSVVLVAIVYGLDGAALAALVSTLVMAAVAVTRAYSASERGV